MKGNNAGFEDALLAELAARGLAVSMTTGVRPKPHFTNIMKALKEWVMEHDSAASKGKTFETSFEPIHPDAWKLLGLLGGDRSSQKASDGETG